MEVVLGALLGALIASMFGLGADAVRRRWRRDDKHLERLQQRAETAGDELLGALADMRSRLQDDVRPEEEPDLSDLTGLLRRRSQLIPNPEVRRRLVLIVRCADEWWVLRNFHGAVPRTVGYRLEMAGSDALGAMLRGEPLPPSAVLDEYEAALEEYASLNEEARREDGP